MRNILVALSLLTKLPSPTSTETPKTSQEQSHPPGEIEQPQTPVQKSLPRFDAPIGIMNDHGYCYAVQFLQLMNAVRYTAPEIFDKVLIDSPHSLLDGYAKTLSHNTQVNRNQFQGFADQRHCLSPAFFMRSFVEMSPDRAQKIVFEEQTFPDGTKTTNFLGPWKEAVHGGDTHVVMKAFLEQWDVACSQRNVVNPFNCSYLTPTGEKGTCYWVPLHSLSNTETTKNHVATPTPPAQVKIIHYPQFLIAVNDNFKATPQAAPPLQIPVAAEGSTTNVLYKAVGISYAFPVILHNKGFDSNHSVTIVRYGNVCYLCDNESVTPFVNLQAAIDWVEKAATLTYSGPGIPSSGLTRIVPIMVIYERVSS